MNTHLGPGFGSLPFPSLPFFSFFFFTSFCALGGVSKSCQLLVEWEEAVIQEAV